MENVKDLVPVILYLTNKQTYLTKMSRVRFHAINALSKITKLTWWGIGWDNYDNNKTVQENIDITFPNIIFDLVIAYKPLEMKEFCNIKFYKCITYNEMYDFPATLKEIEESMADLVVCHHENDMKTYQSYYSNYHGQKNKDVRFFHNPHCAEKTIFKDYGLPKKYDILVCGRLNCINTLGESHYPFRDRLAEIIKKIPKKYKCGIHKHPKSFNADSHTDKYLIEFAQAINSARICVTCSGLPKTRFGKYVEIPMCNTVLAGDIPNQNQDQFRKFMIELDNSMSDTEIIKRLTYYLDDDNINKYEELRSDGYEWSQHFTQEDYARRLIEILRQLQMEKNSELAKTIYA